jgi:hypothetical protein
MIIGFSAKKQGGKTTAINSMLENLKRWDKTASVLNFADMLKIVVAKTLIPAEVVDKPLLLWIDENKDYMLSCGLTVRQALQKVGTDWFRSLEPDAWVNAWKQNVALYASTGRDIHVLVGDVRFPNEVKAIQDMGGYVIRLLRNPFPDDQHASETALDGYEGFDALVDNREMTIEQQNKAVWDLIKEKGWLKKDGK